MTTDYKVTELFCIIDEFCKHFDAENAGNLLEDNSGVKRRRRAASLSDSEIMTILLYFHFGTFRNFKHYYLFFIKGTMKSYFPKAVSYNRFVELESRVFFQLMFFLNLGAFGRCTGITFVDSTMIPVCHNLRRYANKVFKGIATDGKGTMGWCHGFKLHLACNDRGEIIAFVLTGANVSDKDPNVFKVLAKRLYGKLFADKGYISQKLFDFLFEDGIQLVTGLRVNMKNKLMPFYDRMMLRKRYIIETINDMLKNTAQIVHSRHRSVSNFIMNLISALGHIASSTISQRHCRDTASKTPISCHYSKGKTSSFSLLLLPTPNGMGRRRIHAAFILYKTLGYPELGFLYNIFS